MSLSGWFARNIISDAEIRAEIWKLGTRHGGYPLEGALQELKAPGLPEREASLLRACVRDLQRR